MKSPDLVGVDEMERAIQREERWARKLSVILARERHATRRGQWRMRRRIRRRRMRALMRRQDWTWPSSCSAVVLALVALSAIIVACGLALTRWVKMTDYLVVDLPCVDVTWRLAEGWVAAVCVAAILVVWQSVQARGLLGSGPLGRTAESSLINARRFVDATTRVSRKLFASLRRWLFPPLRAWGLLRSIAVMLGIASIVVVLAYWQLSKSIEYSPDRTSGGDLVRAALTIAGLIGGTVALVVAYRRQRGKEAAQFVERFGEAAKQLGDEDPAVRLAGVYAMASVADESSSPSFRQQCVDVLCGYLRMPHEVEDAMPGLVERSRKYSSVPPLSVESTDTFRFRYHDDEVRKSIVRVLAEHLQPKTSVTWSDCRIDLTGATLVSANFSGCVFNKRALFSKAVFVGDTYFNGTCFHDDVVFIEARFLGVTNFVHRERDGGNPTMFHKEASFEGSTFEKFVALVGAQFIGPVCFSRRRREGAPDVPARQTRFKTGVLWRNVRFADRFECESATVVGHIQCEDASFESRASFSGTLTTGLHMKRIRFDAHANFLGCTIEGVTRLDTMTFRLGAAFSGTVFGRETEPGRESWFGPWALGGPVYFTDCAFPSLTFFSDDIQWELLRMPWNHMPEELASLIAPTIQPDTVHPFPWPGPEFAPS